MGELKNPKNNPDRESELQAFIAEIAKMKRLDAERGWPIHLIEVIPSELTEEDAMIYQSVKKGSITKEEFEAYTRNIVDEKGNPREGIPKSRDEFRHYITNLAQVIFFRKIIRRKEEGRRRIKVKKR